MPTILLRRLLVALLLTGVAPALSAQEPSGVGDVAIMPTRIVLQGSDRTAEVMLINTGTAENTYRISFVEMEMTADGRLREVAAENAPWSAARLIRYSPRQVTLAPGTSQVIRMQILRGRDLQAGEYRSHLLVRGVPPATSNGDAPRKEGIVTEIVPVYGVTIPVIVRHGEVTAAADLATPVLRRATSELSVEVRRSGAASLFGDLEVTFRPNAVEEPTTIFRSKVALYPPVEARTFTVPLQFPGAEIPAAGEIVVTFRDPAVEVGDTVKLDLASDGSD